MSWKKEPCRNFQRGSCRYGDHCKFLHVNRPQDNTSASPFQATQQQQLKPNPFGFGTGSKSRFSNTNHHHQQQQKPNPFGFGVQNPSQSKGAPAFGVKSQSSSQTFENKWVRPTSSTPSEKTVTQPQHKCTDPESCKRLIVEDFNHEKPLWKLTCYAHFKSLPCDIVGDICYEELRLAAYEDARQGLPLESIVQRERNLLSSKLVEFENLLANPYVITQSTKSTNVNLFPAISNLTPFSSAQNNAPPQAFTFGQPTPVSNLGPNLSSPSNAFGSSIAFQAAQEANNGFREKDQTLGSFGGRLPSQSFGISPGAGLPYAKNTETNQINTLSTFSNNLATQTDVNSTSQIPMAPMGAEVDKNPKDNSIWLQATWKIKEIPEEEPPPKFCV